MAISLVATASANGATGNVSITHGFTIKSGDVIIALINGNGAGQTTTDNNGSTQFTAADSAANPDSATAYIFQRICTGSEPASYAFTQGSSGRWSIILRQYQGVDAAVWDVAPAAGNRATGLAAATATAPSITISTIGSVGLVLLGDDWAPTTTTYTSNNNGYSNAKSQSGQQYAVTLDKFSLPVGATGETIVTSSGWVSYVIWQCALKPALEKKIININQAVSRAATY
jgi:hypothetical protein